MENIVLGMEPVAGPFVKWAEVRRRAAGAMAQLGRADIQPGDAGAPALHRRAAARGNRPRHRRRRAGAGARRTDEQPRAG